MTGPRPRSHLRLRTASRLHFGLLGWGPEAIRQFGGVGLMIEDPGIEILAEPASEWAFEGPLAQRVQRIVHQIRDAGSGGGEPARRVVPARLQVVSAPPEHVGLGVGTQLGLAVVRLLCQLAGEPEPSAEALARLSGRGRRSGIGLHGFLRGGLIVDGGRRDEATPPPLIARLKFPEDWSVLTIQPPGPRGRHGADELDAFSRLPPPSESTTERLCRLVLLGILPAVAEHDLPAFGAVLHELQVQVGQAFAPVQGGIYSNPRSESIVAELGRLGLSGAGQTSWGPTLFAFGEIPASDRVSLAAKLVDRFHLDASLVNWTSAANHGAVLEGSTIRQG